jgi:hypothetical protein
MEAARSVGFPTQRLQKGACRESRNRDPPAAVAGREYSTGIHIDFESDRSLPACTMSSACPRCGAKHEWSTREARFEGGSSSSNRRPAT